MSRVRATWQEGLLGQWRTDIEAPHDSTGASYQGFSAEVPRDLGSGPQNRAFADLIKIDLRY